VPSPDCDYHTNVIVAHARLQGELLHLMMASAAGYEDGDVQANRTRLSADAQSVVDSAIALKRAVLLGGDDPLRR
jgi:hypothetical protein